MHGRRARETNQLGAHKYRRIMQLGPFLSNKCVAGHVRILINYHGIGGAKGHSVDFHIVEQLLALFHIRIGR